MSIRHISAVTLFVGDMGRACRFYRALGFDLKFGGDQTNFTSLYAGQSYLNLAAASSVMGGGGRYIFHVDDVDAFHDHAVAYGLTPEFSPQDAPWGERYFHIQDPDGHELSFATPLPGGPY